MPFNIPEFLPDKPEKYNPPKAKSEPTAIMNFFCGQQMGLRYISKFKKVCRLKLSMAEAYSNLNIVLENMKKQGAEKELINSVILAQKSLLAIEMMGLASQTNVRSAEKKKT